MNNSAFCPMLHIIYTYNQPFKNPLNLQKSLQIKDFFEVGAEGGTRTRTPFYWPRILSPVRLPFRHSGNRLLPSIYNFFKDNA
jgi:hypothetical protein